MFMEFEAKAKAWLSEYDLKISNLAMQSTRFVIA